MNKVLRKMALTVLTLLLVMGGVSALAFADVAIEQGAGSVTQSAYGVSAGNVVYYGSYPQSVYTPISPPSPPAADTIYTDTDGTQFVYVGSSYFKIEPIAWRVLSNDGTNLFLLAEKNIDGGVPYNATYIGVTWETSTLRSWLNGYTASESGASVANPYSGSFLDSAFSTAEQSAITTTEVVNGATSNPSYPALGGADTQDKVFLLSVAEVQNSTYGFVGRDDLRIAVNTAHTANKPGMGAAGVEDLWWLRSPGNYAGYAASVGNDGSVFGLNVVYVYVGVRPALNLDLSSVIFTSAASGASSKSTATVGGDFIGAVSPTTPVNFTVQDAGQTLDVIATTAQSTQSVPATGALAFSYANATVGSNQYVSAVLVDSGGDVAYYTKLADSSSTPSDTLSVPLTGVAGDTYTLKIFSEQANGDNYTDFASTPITMTLAVAGGTATVSDFVAGGGTIVATAPDAPTAVTAVAGDAQATVSFSPPASDGGSPITGYTVTATPVGGGTAASATGTASPITVSGLTNGVAYTFTVVATNTVGAGTASAASNAVTPQSVTGSGEDESGDPDGSGSGSGTGTDGSTLPGTGDSSLPPALLTGILGLAGLGLSVISTRRKSYVGVHRR